MANFNEDTKPFDEINTDFASDLNSEKLNKTQESVSQIFEETRVSPRAIMPPPLPLSWPPTASSFDYHTLWKQHTEIFSKFSQFLKTSYHPTGPPETTKEKTNRAKAKGVEDLDVDHEEELMPKRSRSNSVTNRQTIRDKLLDLESKYAAQSDEIKVLDEIIRRKE